MGEAMTPNGLIRWYVARRDGGGAPGVNLVDSEGRRYNKRCGKRLKSSVPGSRCQSDVRHVTNEGTYVCGRCGEPWSYHDRWIMRKAVQVSVRPDATEDQLLRYVDVSLAFDRFVNDDEWKWAARLYVASVFGWSAADLTRAAPLEWDSPRWTERAVVRMIQDAAREWTRRTEPLISQDSPASRGEAQ
jgi:hypothetical protein